MHSHNNIPYQCGVNIYLTLVLFELWTNLILKLTNVFTTCKGYVPEVNESSLHVGELFTYSLRARVGLIQPRPSFLLNSWECFVEL